MAVLPSGDVLKGTPMKAKAKKTKPGAAKKAPKTAAGLRDLPARKDPRAGATAREKMEK